MDWQPIDTHPKTEREPFLVYAPFPGARTNGMNVFKVWWDAGSECLTGFEREKYGPTHWMPMPPAPQFH